MTANAMKEDGPICRQAGMDSYIAKPVRERDLYAVIAQVAAGRLALTEPATPLLAACGPASAEATRCIFDRQELMDRLDGAEDLVEKFISLFLDSVDGHLAELGEALGRDDVNEVFFRAHTVGGTAANVGAPQIRAIASKMEALAKRGTLTGVPELFRDLQLAFGDFQSVVGDAGKG